MRIILSNLDTIVLNVKYNLVSAVSKKRKRFSRGRRWSSHESGQNWEAKDRPRTAMYTRPLLIICHRLSAGRAKIFLRQFSLFFFTRFAFFSPPLSILFPTSFSFLFLLWSRRRTVIDDNTRHLFLSFYSPSIGQQKQRFSHLAILHPFTLLYTRNVWPIDASISSLHQRWINRIPFKEYPYKNHCRKDRAKQGAIRETLLSTLQLFQLLYRDFIIFRNIVSRTDTQTVPSSGFYVYYVSRTPLRRTLHQRLDHVFFDSYFSVIFSLCTISNG